MTIKTIILYRVVQEWRAPVFERLSEDGDLDIEVWHGPDFKNTKIVSTKRPYSFKKRRLWSFKIKLKSRNGIIASGSVSAVTRLCRTPCLYAPNTFSHTCCSVDFSASVNGNSSTFFWKDRSWELTLPRFFLKVS